MLFTADDGRGLGRVRTDVASRADRRWPAAGCGRSSASALAYFLIAVIVPTLLLLRWEEPGEFTFGGSLWSLAGGAAGALGALGIIMAFNFGGKPIFVMPLVFGGAPVINTFVSLHPGRQLSTNCTRCSTPA